MAERPINGFLLIRCARLPTHRDYNASRAPIFTVACEPITDTCVGPRCTVCFTACTSFSSYLIHSKSHETFIYRNRIGVNFFRSIALDKKKFVKISVIRQSIVHISSKSRSSPSDKKYKRSTDWRQTRLEAYWIIEKENRNGKTDTPRSSPSMKNSSKRSLSIRRSTYHWPSEAHRRQGVLWNSLCSSLLECCGTYAGVCGIIGNPVR